jgi:EamA-like transporter family
MPATLRATLIGFSAVLMWSLLSLLTVASGRVPPFQLAAMTFAIGGGIGAATWLVRRGAVSALRQPPEVWALGVAGLFGYHALYFMALRLAPPAEAQLVNYLWPLLIVLFSALLPDERLKLHHVAGVLLGLLGTIVLFLGRGGLAFATEYLPGFAAAFVAAFVWSTYSLFRRADRCGRGLLPGDVRPLGDLPPAVRGDGMADDYGPVARDARARHRPGRCGLLCLGFWREAGRHPRPGRGLLRGADPVHLVPGAGRLCGGQRVARAGSRTDHGRRPLGGQGPDHEAERR